MTRAFSIYLDLVRFTAAFLVYLYHSNQRFLSTNVLPASNYGHSSVIVFFVLSGFVIAYVTGTKESTWPAYSASRISRVLSVSIPAVLLTVLLDAIGRKLYPEIYHYPFDQFTARILGSLLFLNETWTISITSFSNVPYWSICYEWWYYVGFAGVMFLTGVWRYVSIVILALLLGPKIVLLAPIWMLGVVLYRWQRPQALPLPAAWALVIATFAGIVLFHTMGVSEFFTDVLKRIVGESRHQLMTFSKFFIGDYILGLLVFTNFMAMRIVAAAHPALLLVIAKPVRFLAAYTFTLYLLHQPLFLFWGAVIKGNPTGYGYWVLVSVLTMASILAIGSVTEQRRHVLRKALQAQLTRLQSWRAASARS